MTRASRVSLLTERSRSRSGLLRGLRLEKFPQHLVGVDLVIDRTENHVDDGALMRARPGMTATVDDDVLQAASRRTRIALDRHAHRVSGIFCGQLGASGGAAAIFLLPDRHRGRVAERAAAILQSFRHDLSAIEGNEFVFGAMKKDYRHRAR